MPIQTVNPTTGKIEKVFKPTTPLQITKKLEQAKKGQHVWKTMKIAKRLTYIQKIVRYLQKNKVQLAKLVTKEMGRAYKDSLAEIDKSISICEFYVQNGEKFLQEYHVPTESSKSYIRYDPLGVILGIMPWNYPFTQVMKPLIPVLVAGNAFVLKHASNVPQCARAIEKMFAELDFPPGVFTNLLLEGKEIEQVIADDRIAGVTLTGSEQTGARVAEVAGKNLKKVVLELGGSDAFVVLEDADIEKTVTQAVKARFLNAGQTCNSPKRFILTHKIAKQFTDLFLEQVAKLKVGDPFDPQTDVGPMAQEKLYDKVEKQINDSLKKGARLLHGGKKMKRPGFFYEITVVDKVKKGMPLFDEEVFGPVSSFITVKNDAEAIRVANDTHLGLSASVWTQNLDRAHTFIEQLHVGLVFVNQSVRSDPRLPVGGVKKSGYGRELGEFGIKEFTNIKTIVIK